MDSPTVDTSVKTVIGAFEGICPACAQDHKQPPE